jgi:hypothetical protein
VAEPTLAEVMDMLKSMRTEMSTLKSGVATMKDKSSSSSGGGDDRRSEGPRDQDFHPKHKKWDFPRYMMARPI